MLRFIKDKNKKNRKYKIDLKFVRYGLHIHLCTAGIYSFVRTSVTSQLLIPK